MTIEQYQAELETLMHDVYASIRALGEKIVRARKDLPSDVMGGPREYNKPGTLWNWMRSFGWTDADLIAAEAVGRGELDVRLFPTGTRNSKVIALSATDQARLLSTERFPVWNNFGGQDERTWAEMTPDQRNRLLGNKGGHIHTLAEQKRPGGTTERVILYDSASFYDGVLRLNTGRSRGEIHAGMLAKSMPPGELEKFITALRG